MKNTKIKGKASAFSNILENRLDLIQVRDLQDKVLVQLHRQRKKQVSIKGAWTDEENMVYANFIEENSYEFANEQRRRKYRVFERMSLELPRRTSIQCRSHNQKMQLLAGDIMKIPLLIKKKNLGNDYHGNSDSLEKRHEKAQGMVREEEKIIQKNENENENEHEIESEGEDNIVKRIVTNYQVPADGRNPTIFSIRMSFSKIQEY